MTPRKYAHPLHFSATDSRKLIPVLGWYVHMSFQDINYSSSLVSICVETKSLRNWICLWRVLKEEIQVFMNYNILSFLFCFASQLRKAAKVKEKRNWERFEFTFKVACVAGAWKKEWGAWERIAREEGACSFACLPPVSRSFLRPLLASLPLKELCHEIFLNWNSGNLYKTVLISVLHEAVNLPFTGNGPFARWRHFTTTTRILQSIAFLCKLRLSFVI